MQPPIMATPFQDGDLNLEFSRFVAHPVHKVPTYYFHLRHAETGEEMGMINLRISSSVHVERYAGHIGYLVHPQFRGHRYAARALRLLQPFARKLQLDPLWITCDPENIPSQRSLELAGAQLVETVDVPPDCIIFQHGHPRKCR